MGSCRSLCWYWWLLVCIDCSKMWSWCTCHCTWEWCIFQLMSHTCTGLDIIALGELATLSVLRSLLTYIIKAKAYSEDSHRRIFCRWWSRCCWLSSPFIRSSRCSLQCAGLMSWLGISWLVEGSRQASWGLGIEGIRKSMVLFIRCIRFLWKDLHRNCRLHLLRTFRQWRQLVRAPYGMAKPFRWFGGRVSKQEFLSMA